MKSEYKYIRFVDMPDLEGRKTHLWACRNIRSDSPLGSIRWYGPWRQYCFFPSSATVYSAGCLADIQDFISQAMKARK